MPVDRYRVALLGEGVRPSLTPSMHMAEAQHLGIPYEYDVWDLSEMNRTADDIGALIAQAESEGYDAINITHPLKQVSLPFLDDLSEEAELIGAVNLVIFRDGLRHGHNTDAVGFGEALADGLPAASLDRVVQLGTGGAGSATAYALLSAGAKTLALTDKLPERAERLAAHYRAVFPHREITTFPLADDGPLRAATGVVNATPVGMHMLPGTPLDVAVLAPGTWVADVIYRPVETELVIAARERGLRTLDGGRMAVGQAVASLRLITGRQPDRPRVRRQFLDLVAQGA